MRSRVLVLLFSAMAAIAACRQADGPMPPQSGEIPNRIDDMSRDLLAIGRGEEQARQDLSDDLRVFIDEKPTAAAQVNELASRVATAISQRKVSDEQAKKLAYQLWLSVDAKELSERQVETLQKDVEGLLTSMGVAQQGAQQVSAQVLDVQKQITGRQKRWYELF
jgi:hypothetical protein